MAKLIKRKSGSFLPTKYAFELTIHNASNFASKIGSHPVLVKITRGDTTLNTRAVKTRDATGIGEVASWEEKISMSCTLYKDPNNRFDQKQAKLSIKSEELGKRKSIGSVTINLAEYAVPAGVFSKTVSLAVYKEESKGKFSFGGKSKKQSAMLKITIASHFLKDSGPGSEDARSMYSSRTSGSTGTSGGSDEDKSDDEDKRKDDDSDSESGRRSRGRGDLGVLKEEEEGSPEHDRSASSSRRSSLHAMEPRSAAPILPSKPVPPIPTSSLGSSSSAAGVAPAAVLASTNRSVKWTGDPETQDLQEKVMRLTEDRAAAAREKMAAKKELAELEVEHTKVQDENEALTRRVNEMQEQIEDLTSQIQQLQERLEEAHARDLDDELDEAEKRAADAEEESVKLRTEIETLKAAAVASAAAASAAVAVPRSSSFRDRDELSRLRSENQKLKEQAKTGVGAVSDVDIDAHTDTPLHALRLENDRLLAENVKLKQQVEESRSAVRAVVAPVPDVAFRARIQELESELELLKDEAEHLKADNMVLTERAAATALDVQIEAQRSSQESLKELKAERDALKEENDYLKVDNDKLSQEMMAANAARGSAKDEELDELEDHLEQALAKSRSLEAENAKLGLELASLRTQLADLSALADQTKSGEQTARNEVLVLEQRLTDLNDQLEKAVAANRDLERSAEEDREAVDRLEKELQETKGRLAQVLSDAADVELQTKAAKDALVTEMAAAAAAHRAQVEELRTRDMTSGDEKKAMIAKVTEENRALHEQLEARDEEAKKLSMQVESLREEMDKSERLMQEVNSRHDKIVMERDNLSRQLEAQSGDSEGTVEELNMLRKELAEVRDEKDETLRRLQESTRALEQVQSRVHKLTAEVDELASEREELREQCESARKQVQMFEAQIGDLRNKEADVVDPEEVNQLRRQVKDVKEKLQDAIQERDDAVEGKWIAEQQLAALAEDRGVAAVEKSRGEDIELKQQVKDLRADVERLDAELRAVSGERDSLLRRMQETEKQRADVDGNLSKELAATKAESAKLRSKLDDALRRAEDAERRLDEEMDSDMDEDEPARSTSQELRAELLETRERAEQAEQRVKELMAEKKKLERSSRERENGGLQNALDDAADLKRQLSDAQKQIDRLKSDLEQSQDEVKREKSTTESQLTALESELISAKMAFAEIAGEREELHARNLKLTKQMAALESMKGKKR